MTVEGCRKDRNSKACKVKRNVNAAININFVPDFDGEDITMMAYAVMPMIEKAFPDMDPNACNYTTCPVENGVAQTYSFGLKMAPTYPLVSITELAFARSPEFLAKNKWLLLPGFVQRALFAEAGRSSEMLFHDQVPH